MTDSKTRALLARRHAVVARGVGIFAGEIAIDSARGATLVDADGGEMIDLAAGLGVMSAGHCDPRVVRAITQQAERLIHTCIHVASYEPYIALCEKLAELLPHGGETKAMLVNSGAEAVENAIKIARQATGRPAVICYEGAFHGRTLLGMTLTAKNAYKTHCGPFAPEVYRVPFPNYFRGGDGLSLEAFVTRELARLRARFVTGSVPHQHVAAIIIEPVQGEGGFVCAPPAYLRGLRALCDELGILLICDEVQSGFCRTGKWAAYEHADVVPDLSTWAKALGGGLPLGAVVGRGDVMDAAAVGTIGGTYGGNPVACAAALATIAVMQHDGLAERARHIGARVRERFAALAERCDAVADVRGLGAMIALELCHGRDPSRPAPQLAQSAVARCRAAGVLVLKAGPYGNVIRVLAPLVIDDAALERALDVIASSVLAAAAVPAPGAETAAEGGAG